MLELFKEFLDDDAAPVMYITGPAGTGKTTALKELVDYCMYNNKATIVCAFTHKACGILRDKLSQNAPVTTLWSLLRKQPTVNEEASKVRSLEIGRQTGEPSSYDVIFIDEFSQVGDDDYSDLNDACVNKETGQRKTKVVFIGDLNQLPPVQDVQAVNPHGKYWIKLKKIYRTTNRLLEPLGKLVSYIEGDEEPQPLEGNEFFHRGVDLVQQYKSLMGEDVVLLAFTNERVQELNALIQGHDTPQFTDFLFSPTSREYYFFANEVNKIDVKEIDRPFSWANPVLKLGSKYRTLEHLLGMPEVKIATVNDAQTEKELQIAYVFGHYTYKQIMEDFKKEAVAANNDCRKALKDSSFSSVRSWSQYYHRDPRSIRRRLAWRNLLTFKECVVCLDFAHALTVHKSQGSTFEYVCLDTQDIGRCAKMNFDLYLKLMYVGISRASHMVYTN